MSEKANLSLTILTIFASFSFIPCRVKPTFKDTMCILTAISSSARAGPAKLRANGAGVVVLPGVPPAGLFARMSEGAVGSVVAPAPVAPPDFELEQPEVLRRVGVVVGVVGAVVGEEFPEKGFVGGGK